MGIRSHSLSRKQVKESVKYSVYEGMAASAAEGATDDYYTPYALAAGASLSQVGWLVTLQQFLASFCYLKLSNLASVVGSRKRLILILVLTDVITFLPFIVLPYFLRAHLVEGVFFFFVLAAVPSVIIGPVWANWITDLIPTGVRGRYFGQRSTFTGASGLACFIVAGLVLNYFNNFDGFALVFGFAALCRLMSWTMFWKMHDIPIKQKESRVTFGLADFRQVIGSARFGHFMVYSALFYFAVNLSSPFLAAFMLQDLQFSYLIFMVMICSSEIAKLCIYRFWGRYADAAGHLKVVKIASFIIPAGPLLWMVSHNIYYLIVVQILSGLAWAGFELCSPNFVYSAMPANNRIKFIACYRALNGMGIALGALVGGYLATHLPPLFGHTLLALFLVSGLARLLVVFRLLPSIVDVARKRTGESPWAYKVTPTPVHRPALDNAAWALLYAPMGQRIGDALGANHVLYGSLQPERRGLYYNRAAHIAARKTKPDQEAKPQRTRSNFKQLQGALAVSRPRKPDLSDAPGAPEQKGLFYHRVWQGLKDLVTGKESPAPALQTSAQKPPLLYDKAAWRTYLTPAQEKIPGKGQAMPRRESMIQRAANLKDGDGKPKGADEAPPKPAEGLLHKPAAWTSMKEKEGPDKTAAAGPPHEGALHHPSEWRDVKEKAEMDNTTPPKHEGLLHKPSQWERPAPPEPPKGRPEPEHKGVFYDPAAQQAVLKETDSTAKTPFNTKEPDQHGLFYKKGDRQQPEAWNRNAPEETRPDEAPKPAHSPHREPMLRNPGAWDRFTEKKKAGAPRRGIWPFRSDKEPSPKDKATGAPPPQAPPRGLLHRPESWSEHEPGTKKPPVTKDGLPVYPRRKRPSGGR